MLSGYSAYSLYIKTAPIPPIPHPAQRNNRYCRSVCSSSRAYGRGTFFTTTPSVLPSSLYSKVLWARRNRGSERSRYRACSVQPYGGREVCLVQPNE